MLVHYLSMISPPWWIGSHTDKTNNWHRQNMQGKHFQVVLSWTSSPSPPASALVNINDCAI